jgi:hypothetical protein
MRVQRFLLSCSHRHFVAACDGHCSACTSPETTIGWDGAFGSGKKYCMETCPTGYTEGTKPICTPPTAAQAPIVSLKLNNKLNSGATTYIDSVNSIEWTPAAAVFPAFDRGLYFDGSTDNGVLSNNTLKLFHSFTMEAWVRVTHSRVIR